jgi:RNA polymerase primary sigma factor
MRTRFKCLEIYSLLIFAIISMGLSRERVRQVGLVALEKLKHAARKGKLEAMLVKH